MTTAALYALSDAKRQEADTCFKQMLALPISLIDRATYERHERAYKHADAQAKVYRCLAEKQEADEAYAVALRQLALAEGIEPSLVTQIQEMGR